MDGLDVPARAATMEIPDFTSIFRIIVTKEKCADLRAAVRPWAPVAPLA
jgi:hypothetical protein